MLILFGATVFILFDIIFSMIMIRVPSLSSNKFVIKKIIDDPYFKDIFVQGKVLYDLGCGRGMALFALTKKFPVKSTGFEINPAVLLYAKVKRLISGSKVRKNSKIKFGNFFKTDLSKADIIYLYLFPEIVEKLEEKIKKECKTGTYIICNTFCFQNMEPIWTYFIAKGSLKNIYVYRI